MADYLTSNRNEIEKFVHEDGDVFHWDHYFNFLGVLELDINVEAIMTRTRNAIKVCRTLYDLGIFEYST